jgi:chromosomal replication initiator protein
MRQDVTLSTQLPVNLHGQDLDHDQLPENQVGSVQVASTISKTLVAAIGKNLFDLWFESSEAIECDQEQISVFSSNQFRQDRLQSKFGSILRDIVNRVAGPQYSIEYKLVSAASTASPSTDSVQTSSDSQTQTNGLPEQPVTQASGSDADSDDLETEADPQKCFAFHEPDQIAERRARKKKLRHDSDARYVKSFWFGDENRLGKASVDQAFENPGQFSPLLFYGATGCGKTHLLEAIVNDFRRRLRLKRCVFLSAEQFTSQFVGSLRGGSGLPVFRRKYRDLDLLAIDDVQFFASKRATLNEFLHTVDNLSRLGKQVVVASDRPPIELDGLGADLAARLSGGLTCPLQYPGFEGRLRIIEKMCHVRRFKLPVDVMELIANHMTRDVRRITGAVNRLFAVSKSLNEKVTMHLAQEVLADLLVFNGVGTSLVGIEQVICDFCGVKPTELRSKSRRKKVSSARMLAMFLSRRHTSSAFSEIGDHFGGRSHSTVIAAEKKVSQWIANGESVQLPNADYPAHEVIQRIESIMRIG